MRSPSYDGLRVFVIAARCLSFTKAAQELNLTKGAVSYKIGRLEEDLGFRLFHRHHKRITLSEKGQRMWHTCEVAFRSVESEIGALRSETPQRITVGMSTYFASRWLSPKLMTFMAEHSDISLRLQPSNDLADLRAKKIDMAIRWGKGNWRDAEIELLFACPAFPTAGSRTAMRVEKEGLEAVLPSLTLLHDRDNSRAWIDWYQAARLPLPPLREDLVIPDPNV
ncbi:MAG: LysR family transcriptional regulator, partial [Kiloniellales bacterium]|nr:LysR family transcriptional regulator [Kiloniellales bacterium]